MNFRPTLSRLAVAAALAGPLTLTGCSNEANTPEAQSAEQAAGVKPENATSKSVTSKRDLIVTEEKKVQDPKTGEVLSDMKKTTPVSITQEKEVTTKVKVDVGDTKSSGNTQK